MMTISVICEECGKRYDIPPEVMNRIPGQTIHARCRQCGHPITITKPIGTDDPSETDDSSAAEPQETLAATDLPDIESAATDAPRPPTSRPGHRTAGALGLRGKMILLFCVVPLALMSLSGVLSQRQVNALSTLITADSADALRAMAEQQVNTIALSTARQVKTYLDTHPDLRADSFAREPILSSLAGQRVTPGIYTALYQSPGPDGTWRMRLHPDQRMAGRDMAEATRNLPQADFEAYWKILTGVKHGGAKTGYVQWTGPEGPPQQRFVVCTPVPDTGYAILVSADTQAFIIPLTRLQERADALTATTRNLNLGLLVVTLAVIFAIVAIYSHRLTTRIAELTQIADHISVGEMNARIRIHAKDEIGRLALAIARMQDSLRQSIERLRRRR